MDVSWRGPDAVTKGDARIWKWKEIETPRRIPVGLTYAMDVLTPTLATYARFDGRTTAPGLVALAAEGHPFRQ